MKNKKEKNFLEYIPELKNDVEFFERDGNFYLKREFSKISQKIARKLFFTPKYQELKLEGFGGHVLQIMDGNKNILEIGKILKDEFGEEVEPLYERLIKFFVILRDNELITLKEEQ